MVIRFVGTFQFDKMIDYFLSNFVFKECHESFYRKNILQKSDCLVSRTSNLKSGFTSNFKQIGKHFRKILKWIFSQLPTKNLDITSRTEEISNSSATRTRSGAAKRWEGCVLHRTNMISMPKKNRPKNDENRQKSIQNRWTNEGREKKAFRDHFSWFLVIWGMIFGLFLIENIRFLNNSLLVSALTSCDLSLPDRNRNAHKRHFECIQTIALYFSACTNNHFPGPTQTRTYIF